MAAAEIDGFRHKRNLAQVEGRWNCRFPSNGHGLQEIVPGRRPDGSARLSYSQPVAILLVPHQMSRNSGGGSGDQQNRGKETIPKKRGRKPQAEGDYACVSRGIKMFFGPVPRHRRRTQIQRAAPGRCALQECLRAAFGRGEWTRSAEMGSRFAVAGLRSDYGRQVVVSTKDVVVRLRSRRCKTCSRRLCSTLATWSPRAAGGGRAASIAGHHLDWHSPGRARRELERPNRRRLTSLPTSLARSVKISGCPTRTTRRSGPVGPSSHCSA